MVETVKTLSESSKYQERRACEAEKLVEELKKRTMELSKQVNDKE